MMPRFSAVFLLYLMAAMVAVSFGEKDEKAIADKDGDIDDDSEIEKRDSPWQRRGSSPSLRSWGRGFDRISYASPLSSFHKRQYGRGFDRIGFASPLSGFAKRNYRGFDRIGYASALSNFNKRGYRGFDKISYSSPLSGFLKRDVSDSR